MNIWKTFAENEVTHSTAHYLTAVHELRARRGYARVSDVARELEVTKGTVSIQMKHLKERGLIVEDENGFLLLTPGGESIAHEVMQSRNVVIEFLSGLLGVPADQARIDACKIEHLLGREASHQLLALVHLLQSDDEAAGRFRERFREYKLSCPDASTCKLCSLEEHPGGGREPVADGSDSDLPKPPES
jgi:DtxR family Mn-dependent transcriptional regulator